MKKDDQAVSADDSDRLFDRVTALFEDVKAGRMAPLLEALKLGTEATDVDRRRGAGRRKKADASDSPDEVVRGSLAKLFQKLEAVLNRVSNLIPDEQRDEDCRAVVEALYRLWESKAPELYELRKLPYNRRAELLRLLKLPYKRRVDLQLLELPYKQRVERLGRDLGLLYKQRVKLLASELGISGKRVQEALRQVADVRPALICAPSRTRGADKILSCESGGCADPDDVCLLHGSAEAQFKAGRPMPQAQTMLVDWVVHEPKYLERSGDGYLPSAGSTGKVGFAPLRAHTFPLFRAYRPNEIREPARGAQFVGLVESWVESWRLLAVPLPRLLDPLPAVPQETWRDHPDRDAVARAERAQPVYRGREESTLAMRYRRESAAAARTLGSLADDPTDAIGKHAPQVRAELNYEASVESDHEASVEPETPATADYDLIE
jgi:hypothetical protein